MNFVNKMDYVVAAIVILCFAYLIITPIVMTYISNKRYKQKETM